jgi:autophagy-related protein 13
VACLQDSQFSVDTDDIEEFRDELRVYKQSGSFGNRPPPMIIETYIDASRLSSSQSLVIVDDNGKRWDVMEALNSSESSDDSPRRRHAQPRNSEVILERWRLELKFLPDVDSEREEFGSVLPTVYKRSIAFFRSMFVTTRIMPCFKYSQQALAKGIHPALEVKCRVLSAEPEYTAYDPLRQPLHDGRDAVTDYVFTDLEVPVGRFYSSVTYRNDCSFRVDDAESLLSSRFMGVDENYFRPSIPQRRDSHAEPGSLPSQRQDRRPQDPQQTYGSLSTFHGAGALGTSPITALRAVRPIGSDTSSPSGSISASMEPDPPHSLPIRGAAARPMTTRPYEGSRRPSISFQPFKAGSLSGSPRIPDLEPSSPQSLTRPGIVGPSRAGNRSSLTMGMAASLRGGPSAPQDVPSVSSSPRPPSRYSSSFTHRRGRPSFGGQSKGDDDQVSSGKQSLSSSAQPGSGLLAEAGGVTSSGSFATDDDNISDFLKALDSQKTLKSFEPNKTGESVASKRTAMQLSKFQLMRETNNALTDSMTSSIHLQRSSSSSSRQLTNVPPMVNPTSMSISSSPGKPPISPHTPAIPSRLSENSIIDYQPPHDQQRQGNITAGEAASPHHGQNDDDQDDQDDQDDDDETPLVTQHDSSSPTTTATNTATTAIDIPLSPRLLLLQQQQQQQRPASVAHQHRSIAGEVDSYHHHHHQHHRHRLHHQRSASADGGGEVPTLSALLGFQQEPLLFAMSELERGSSEGVNRRGLDVGVGSEGGARLEPGPGAGPPGLMGVGRGVSMGRGGSPGGGEGQADGQLELGEGEEGLEGEGGGKIELRGVLRKGW